MNTQIVDDTLEIAFASEILSTNVQTLRPQLIKALDEAGNISSVVADLAQARVIDSMGFNLLIGLFRECEKRQMSFRVTNPSPEVLRLIKFLNLTDRFGLDDM
jgi:anti-anti-sigma factor